MPPGRIRWLIGLGGLALLGWGFQAVLEEATLPRADLVIGHGEEPRSLDPAATTAIADSRILHGLFEGLVSRDPRTLEPCPGMAESWSMSDDGLLYEFRLRPGLRWSDGHPLRAGDLRWSFLRFLDPATGAAYAGQLFVIRGAREFTTRGGDDPDLREAVAIEAPDDRTLRIRLARTCPWFLDLLGFFSLYPVPRHVVERHGPDWVKTGNFVSNGPFRLRLRRLRDRIRMERNPFYWDAASVSLETIDLLSVESKTTLLSLYLSGEADWICDVPESALPEIRRRFGEKGTGEFRPESFLNTYYFRLNTDRPPLRSAKLRRALSLAVDREAIVRNVTRSGEPAARSFVPPGIRGYEPPDALRFDPDEARRLFAEGLHEQGLSEAPVVEILYNTRQINRSVAEVLQHQWRTSLGLETRLRNMEAASFREAVKNGAYTIARASWVADYNDPHTFLCCYLGGSANNQTGWRHERYDRLVSVEAFRCGTAAERAAVLQEAERLLLAEAPILPLFHEVSRNLVSPRIRGFHQNVLEYHPQKHLSLAPEQGR